MSNEANSSITPNNTPRNTGTKIASVFRWIFGGILLIFILVTGFHYSSLFLLASVFFMFPFSFVDTFIKKKNIKTVWVIILSIILFFIAIFTSPSSEPIEGSTNETTQESYEETTLETTDSDTETELPTEENTATESNTETATPETTYQETETKVEMVWISSTGEKYHSKASCSNMSSPRQIPLEDAKEQGYTACKKCH